MKKKHYLPEENYNIYLERLFFAEPNEISRDELIKVMEKIHGVYLEKVFRREWDLIEALDVIKELESEHSHDLGLITSYEIQRKQLQSLNKQLTSAKLIHEADLRMAEKVQKSLYFEKAPSTNNYDITLYSRPFSSLSGDLYDFYTSKENDLTGIILADVSGHGIASSLLTILAKPIFYRQFTRRMDTPLGEIMNEINRKLIKQIEASDHYLTALMLRFNNNTLEYANAGHPDIIYRNAKTKKSKELLFRYKEQKGSFLGVSLLERKTESIKFDINKNDILVVFTDCILESKNKKNDTFGHEKIIQALDSISGEESSSEILDILLKDFMEHTRDVPPRDDMTIIIIKKK